jgi:hypothetical protein
MSSYHQPEFHVRNRKLLGKLAVGDKYCDTDRCQTKMVLGIRPVASPQKYWFRIKAEETSDIFFYQRSETTLAAGESFYFKQS